MVGLCRSFSQLWMLDTSTFLQASDMHTLVSPGYTEGFLLHLCCGGRKDKKLRCVGCGSASVYLLGYCFLFLFWFYTILNPRGCYV